MPYPSSVHSLAVELIGDERAGYFRLRRISEVLEALAGRRSIGGANEEIGVRSHPPCRIGINVVGEGRALHEQGVDTASVRRAQHALQFRTLDQFARRLAMSAG